MKISNLLALFVFLPLIVSAQNDCENALDISAGVHNIVTFDGTFQAIGTCTPTTAPDFSEWYTYTANFEGSVKISSHLPQNTSAVNTVLVIAKGDCSNLICESASYQVDIYEPIEWSEVDIFVEPGETFYIQWTYLDTNGGFDFEVTEYPIDCDQTQTIPLVQSYNSWYPEFLCWTTQDSNGDTATFEPRSALEDFDGDGIIDDCVELLGEIKDDYLFSNPINLQAGVEYTCTIYHGRIIFDDIPPFGEDDLTVYIADAPSSSASLTEIFSHEIPFATTSNISGPLVSTGSGTTTFTFTQPVNGEFHLGLRVSTDFSMAGVYINSISLDGEVLGISDNDLTKLQLLPNPATDFITLFSKETVRDISLYNLVGNQIPLEYTQSYNDQYKLNLSQVPSGIYFVSVSFTGSKMVINKQIIVH